MTIKPYLANQIIVKIVRQDKVGSILMSNFKFDAFHNAQKMFRHQECEVIDMAGIEFEGLKAGDLILTRRWAAKPVKDTDYATLTLNRICAKIEDAGS